MPLAVLYEDGVKFFAFPGEPDPGPQANETTQFAPFKDGRKKPFDIVTIASRRYMVQRGGVQTSVRGELTVEPCVTFWADGIEYELISPRGGGVSAEKLLDIAKRSNS